MIGREDGMDEVSECLAPSRSWLRQRLPSTTTTSIGRKRLTIHAYASASFMPLTLVFLERKRAICARSDDAAI